MQSKDEQVLKSQEGSNKAVSTDLKTPGESETPRQNSRVQAGQAVKKSQGKNNKD